MASKGRLSGDSYTRLVLGGWAGLLCIDVQSQMNFSSETFQLDLIKKQNNMDIGIF